MNRLTMAMLLAATLATPAAAQGGAAAEATEPVPETEAEPDTELAPDAEPAPDAELAPETEPEPDTELALSEPTSPATLDPEPETAIAAADPEPETSITATAAEEETPAARPGPQFTFANSFFSWTNALTVHSFAPAAQLSYDPTYVMWMTLTPRFYLTDTTFLWLNQGASMELTDTNDGTYNREPLLSDTLLDLRQLLSWEGFVFQLQGRLGFPLSKDSQAAGRVLQTGVGLTVARPFPELAGFTVALTGGYRRWWATRNVRATGEPYPGNCVTPDAAQGPVCTQASGLTTARDILIGGLLLNITPVAGLTVSASGFYMAAYGHELADATVPINGGTETIPDESVTHWRPFTYFSLAVAYDVLPWLNLQLGIQNAGVVAPLYNPDGSVRSPFTADTQVFLTTTIGLDTLYGEIVGGGEDDGLTPEERQRRRQGLAGRGGATAAF